MLKLRIEYKTDYVNGLKKSIYMKTKGWQRVLLIIIPYLIIVGLLEFVGMVLAGVPIKNTVSNSTICQDLIVVVFGAIGTLTIISFFIKCVDNENISSSLKLTKWINFRGVGICSFCILFILGIVFILLKIFDEIEFIDFDFNGTKLLASIFLFVLVAISEELIIRGYILKNLLQSFSIEIALLLSSILFVLMHLFNPEISWIGIINLFFAGIILGLIYMITDSIWYPILAHFFWNFFQTHLGFNISGQNSYSLINIIINEKSVFNGGQFGIEGSILSAFMLIISSIILFLVFQKKKRLNLI